MKIIVFGVGKYYKNRKEKLNQCRRIEIVAFTDNNASMWGKWVDGVKVFSPESIMQISFDAILIMNNYAKEVESQLLTLGVKRSQIRFWEPFYAEMRQGERKIYEGTNKIKFDRRVLIISTVLNYTGGSLAAVYAALTLHSRGYYVVLAAPDGNANFIEETQGRGVTVAICPSLPYVYREDREWVSQFDTVIVNVFQMMHSACACSMICPTLWWIHEPAEVYDLVMDKPWNRIEKDLLNDINIYSVSNLAKKNFNTFFPGQIHKTLCYGIPDNLVAAREEITVHKKMIFAVIGVVCKRKAQDIFVNAVSKFKYKEQAEFWIIGLFPDDEFGRQIREMSDGEEAIKLLGVMTRKEIYKIFPQIDVVVCPSREETMSIAINEGMMFGKACITTDNTGVAEYIQDGENGYIVPTGDVIALRDKMEWVIEHRKEIGRIGKAARKTYEQYFTMEAFGERMEKALIETKQKWRDNKCCEILKMEKDK